jgi:2-iminobutanoate/2-iminopropanoate deaminase
MKFFFSTLICLLLLGCGSGPNEIKKVIASDKAPKAIGPYSQAIQVEKTLYLAGQIALDPKSGELIKGGIEIQTHRVMQNLGAILSEADFDFEDVVQVQVFLSDLKHYKIMNAIYTKYFSASYPARVVVEVARIPRDALVEIMMVAQKL